MRAAPRGGLSGLRAHRAEPEGARRPASRVRIFPVASTDQVKYLKKTVPIALPNSAGESEIPELEYIYKIFIGGFLDQNARTANRD